jgi:hypothetical protein
MLGFSEESRCKIFRCFNDRIADCFKVNLWRRVVRPFRSVKNALRSFKLVRPV